MEDCSLPQDSLFLGFDCSTQSLKATVLDANFRICATEVVNFDNELPHYKTKDGVLRDPLVNGRIVSPALMWVEALDLILQKFKNSHLEFQKIIAVSGSAQQHGSVYWKDGTSVVLASLESKKPLVEQLHDAFSVKESPIWMDCSSTEQCRAIEKAVGGALELSKLTGSCAHERYAGPQICKIFEKQPQVYENTERISLISSFMASLLLGGYACIDQTDGAGMNLMDIKSRAWSKIALEATAPDLEKKLGNLAPACAVAGFLSQYYVERYHFKKDCLVVQWSGDNPNSLAGLTLTTPGDLAISLGTSDTVFGIAADHKPGLEGHTFPSPVDMKDYMVMLVYKNGSLTREDIRNRCASKSWEVFNTYLQQTPPLNGGQMGFYYKEHEILPPLPIGEHRYVLEISENNCLDGLKKNDEIELDAHNGPKKNGVLNLDAPNGQKKNEVVELGGPNGHKKNEVVELGGPNGHKKNEVVELDAPNGQKKNGVVELDAPNGQKKNGVLDLDAPNGQKKNGVLDLDAPNGQKKNGVLELDAPNGQKKNGVVEFDALNGQKKNGVVEFDAPAEVRALIEGQLLSMRAHAEKIGMPSPPRRIIATGGASTNICILNTMASIFGCDIYTVERPDSASLGAALRAAHGWVCHKKGHIVPFSSMYMNKLEQTSLNCKLSVPAGDQELFTKYTLLMKRRAEIESDLVQKLGRM